MVGDKKEKVCMNVSEKLTSQCLRCIFVMTIFFPSFSLQADPKASVNTKEAQIKKEGGKATVDFEETNISGAKKTPLGAVIEQGSVDKSYDFVEIRKDWHKEMINSATSLDTAPQQGQ